MLKNLSLVIAIALVTAACVSAKATLLNPGVKFDPVPWENVVVYLSEDDVPGEFVKIAIVKSEGKEVVTTEAQMLKKMKKKAGALGANGIILQGIKQPGDVERIADELSGGLGLGSRQVSAIAIRVK